VIVLALGIGTAAAIFAVIDPFTGRPLPYENADRLIVVQFPTRDTTGLGPTVDDWRDRRDLFVDVAAVGERAPYRVRIGDRMVLLQAVEVTENLLPVLGGVSTPLQVPRVDSPTELAVLLSGAGSVRLFGEQSDVVGRLLRTWEGPMLRVAGILPSDFVFPTLRARPAIDALVFFTPDKIIEPRGGNATAHLTLIGRLQPEVPPSVMAGIVHSERAVRGAEAISVQTIHDYLTGHLRAAAAGGVALVVLVLTICAANVGSVALARAVSRRTEIATRRAIGATRADLMGMLVAEQAILAVAGVIAGLGLSQAAVQVAVRVIPVEYAILGVPQMTGRTMIFASLAGTAILGLTVITTWLSWSPYHSGAASVATGLDRRRTRIARGALLAAQSAVATILVVSGGFLSRSYAELAVQDAGFAHETVAVSVIPSPDRTPGAAREEIAATVASLSRLPFVERAGAVIGSLVDDMTARTVVRYAGSAERSVALKFVTEDYFDALGGALLAGRAFTARDDRRVTIVGQSLAREMDAQHDILGRILQVGNRPAEIVGIARDMFDRRLDVRPMPAVFLSMDLEPIFGNAPFSYALSLRAHGPSELGRIRREVERMHPDGIVADVSTLGERLYGSVRTRIFVTIVTTALAFSALVLCTAGLGATVAFTVTRRTREIAIRMAIGAGPLRARMLVLRDTCAAVGIGIGFGVFFGALMSRLLSAFLYGVEPSDPLTLGLATAVMTGTVLVAVWLAAAKATAVQPAVALRVD
jgi:putative ABC transport system permease protein